MRSSGRSGMRSHAAPARAEVDEAGPGPMEQTESDGRSSAAVAAAVLPARPWPMTAMSHSIRVALVCPVALPGCGTSSRRSNKTDDP